MNPRTPSSALVICFLMVIFGSFLLQRTLASDLQSTSSPIGSLPSPENKPSMTPVSSLEGIQFVAGNSSQILLTKDGKQYLIDTSSQKIFEVAAPAEAKQTSQTQESGSTSGQDATVKDNKKKGKGHILQ